MSHRPVRLPEALGLLPIRERARQAVIALRGDADVPASRFDLTSLGQLRPRWSLPLWRGRTPVPRTVLITNLFNHRQTPIEEGWSVRMRQREDFRGGTLTYDSHNGTDFSIPIGTPVCTAAPGHVVRVSSEFQRGGLKIVVDHGEGLLTVYAHLARALVSPGDAVHRGQVIALSGYSGLDGFATFPWGVPHVHMNVWLDGEPVDPFPHHDAASLWRAGRLPMPAPAQDRTPPGAGTDYDAEAVDAVIAGCITPEVRRDLAALPLPERGHATVFAQCYTPTRFPVRRRLTARAHDRTPCLDLPFSAEDFDGVAFVDELSP